MGKSVAGIKSALWVLQADSLFALWYCLINWEFRTSRFSPFWSTYHSKMKSPPPPLSLYWSLQTVSFLHSLCYIIHVFVFPKRKICDKSTLLHFLFICVNFIFVKQCLYFPMLAMFLQMWIRVLLHLWSWVEEQESNMYLSNLGWA